MQPEVRDAQYTLALPPGTRLAERYRLVRPLGSSSAFAILYAAEDSATGASAVIKEFFPRSLVARRADGPAVHPHSPEDERDFVRALRRFVHEGAALAEIDHPHLARARRLIEANGTAYLVMDRQDGKPLTDVVRRAGGRLPATEAGEIVQKLLSALEPLHAESIIHRDISPSSIHVLADGQPILLGFTARRHVVPQSTALAPGFAAFEQYGARDIGPWTDVYAAAAVLYYLLTGNAPPAALERAAGSPLMSPSTLVPEVSASIALAVLRGLSLLPEQRPHSASEFRRQLEILREEGQASSRTGAATAHGLELAALATDRQLGETDSHTSLKLGVGGIVVPHEEGGTARLLRRVLNVTAKLRGASTPERASSEASFDRAEADDRELMAREVVREVAAREQAAREQTTREQAAVAQKPELPNGDEVAVPERSVRDIEHALRFERVDETVVERTIEVEPEPVLETRLPDAVASLLHSSEAAPMQASAAPATERAAPHLSLTPRSDRAGGGARERDSREPRTAAASPERGPLRKLQPWVRPEVSMSTVPEADAPQGSDEQTVNLSAPDLEASRQQAEGTDAAESASSSTAPIAEAARMPALEQIAAELETSPELATAPIQGQWTRRRTVIAVAAVLVLVVGGVTTMLLRSGGLRAQSVASQADAGARVAEQAPATPAAPNAGTHLGVASGAVLQSTGRTEPTREAALAPSDSAAQRVARNVATAPDRTPSTPEPTTRPAAPATRVPNLAPINVAIPTGTTELKMLPPEVLVDARTRLANGEEQTELGEYRVARRIFRTVLQQLDSATARYPESAALRSLRREVEQADQNALRACVAENEMHRKRGEQPGQCQ